jgi:hypothetical protein
MSHLVPHVINPEAFRASPKSPGQAALGDGKTAYGIPTDVVEYVATFLMPSKTTNETNLYALRTTDMEPINEAALYASEQYEPDADELQDMKDEG